MIKYLFFREKLIDDKLLKHYHKTTFYIRIDVDVNIIGVIFIVISLCNLQFS